MNKTILITGAASGIGREAATLFNQNNWNVIGVDVDIGGLEKIKDSCFKTFKCDVSNEPEVKKLANDLKNQGIVLNALFNCAGILQMGLFNDSNIEKHLKVVDVNLKGLVSCTYLFLPLLEKNSTIVNMSSLSALYGTPELAVYSATKSAVKTLTEALNIEFEPQGIHICDIIVDYVKTPMILNADYKATSVRRLGITVSATSVAKTVFKAVTSSKKVHYYVGIKTKVLNFLLKLFPFTARFFAKLFAFRKK